MKNNRICFVTLLFGLVLVFGNNAFAEGDFKLGKVDFYSVILLHPAMKEFDANRNAFVVTRNESEAEQIKKEEEARAQKVKEYEVELLAVKKSILKLESQYKAKITEMNTKYTRAIKNLDHDAVVAETMNLKVDSRKEEKDHENKYKVLEAKYSEIQNRIYDLNNINYDVGFTTPSETEKKFEFIVDEAKRYVKKIADLKEISVVINSSNRQMKRTTKASSYRNMPNYTMDLFTLELSKAQYKDEAGVVGHYETLNDYVHSWLEHGNFVLENLHDNLKDCDIVVGGVDLTSEVLYSLYRDYKVEQSLANAIIQSVIAY